MKIVRLVFLFLVLSGSAQAQLFDHDAMYQSYLAYKVDQWGVPLNKVVKRTDLTSAQKLETVHYIYGYIAICILNEDEKEARFFMQKMEEYLDDLEKLGYQMAMVDIYRSTLAVYEISFSKIKAVSYGKKCLDYLEKAVKLEPNNPMVVSYQGNVNFYMPSFMGGDKKEAIKFYQRAIQLYKNNTNKLYRWNVLETKLTLAQCYEKTGNISKAIAYCEQVLKEEPNYVYMRDIYLPKLKEKVK